MRLANLKPLQYLYKGTLSRPIWVMATKEKPLCNRYRQHEPGNIMQSSKLDCLDTGVCKVMGLPIDTSHQQLENSGFLRTRDKVPMWFNTSFFNLMLPGIIINKISRICQGSRWSLILILRQKRPVNQSYYGSSSDFEVCKNECFCWLSGQILHWKF